MDALDTQLLSPSVNAPARRRLGRDVVALINELFLLADFLSVLVSGYLAGFLAEELLRGRGAPYAWVTPYQPIILVAAIVAPCVLRSQEFTAASGHRPRERLVSRLLARFVALIGVLLAIGLATNTFAVATTSWLLIWGLLSMSLVFASRLRVARDLKRLETQGLVGDVIAVVGAGPDTDRLVNYLRGPEKQRAVEIEVVGVFDDRKTRHGDVSSVPVGSISDLIEIGKTRRIDCVVVALPHEAEPRIQAILHQLKALASSVVLCPQHVGAGASRGFALIGDRLPMPLLADKPLPGRSAMIKNAEDVVLSGLLILLLLPLFAALAIAVWLDSPGPIVYRQRRHGWNNGEFDVFKFRTMRHCEEKSATLQQTLHDDDRITRTGRFLRRTSLDELPQLFNVFRGEMALVGPRPHAVNMQTEQRLGHEIIGEYPHRHRVKPGMTGWAQVNGLRGATEAADQLRRRVEFDLYYIENWSLLFDLRILLKTLWCVLTGKNAY